MVGSDCSRSQRKARKEKTTPFGVNLLKSQVLYWAAQVQHCNHINDVVLAWDLHCISKIRHWNNLSCRQVSFQVHATEVHSDAADSKPAHRWRGEPVLKAHIHIQWPKHGTNWFVTVFVQLTVCRFHALRLSHCHIEIHHLINLREWLKANSCSDGRQVSSPGMGC